MKRHLPLALVLTLVNACQSLPPSGLSRPPASSERASGFESTADPSVRGRAVFPERQVQITASDAVSYATVSLIDPSLGRTLVTGRTNASGTFTLSPDGSFSPPLDSYYYLEVTKRVSNHSFGSNSVAMRTVLKWTSKGWASLTNGTGGTGDVVVNPTTTAVGLIDSEDAAIGFADILGKVGGAPGYTAVTAFGAHTPAEVTSRAATVTSQLEEDVDPVGDRVSPGGSLAPDDFGNAAIHHDYQKTVGGVTSTFVWIPIFTAYQLITPATCGAGNTTKPVGTWVGTKPPSGVEDTDWGRETFGGFYAAKYEASRADAVQGDVGTGLNATPGFSTSLKVQVRCAPWTRIDWDAAANACLAYDSHSHLMRDDEWTALAVWSMINNLTVYGNNNNGKDIDDAAVSFLDDPSYGGVDRALTGTGKKAAWTGATNLTTHTGTTAGVYDLNGNACEWTETLGAAITSGNYVINDITVPVSVAQGYISALSTDPRLRRYGVPGAAAGQTATFGNDYLWKFTSLTSKSLRGGHWSAGGKAGVWALDISCSRPSVDPPVGFRPVLRY